MTPAQNKEYWRQWSAVKKLLTTLGEFSPKDADAERKAIHLEALKVEKSSKDLTNADLDKVLDAFGTRLILLDAQSTTNRAQEQPVKRLIWAINQLGLDAPYIAKICLDQFGTEDWQNLGEKRLRFFRMTLTKRARAKKQKGTTADPGQDQPG